MKTGSREWGSALDEQAQNLYILNLCPGRQHPDGRWLSDLDLLKDSLETFDGRLDKAKLSHYTLMLSPLR